MDVRVKQETNNWETFDDWTRTADCPLVFSIKISPLPFAGWDPPRQHTKGHFEVNGRQFCWLGPILFVWWKTLHQNIRKILIKFCVPPPTLFRYIVIKNVEHSFVILTNGVLFFFFSFYWQRCELYRTPRSGRMEQPVAPIKRSGAGMHVELYFHHSRNVQTLQPQYRSTFRGFNEKDHVVRTGMANFDSRWTALFYLQFSFSFFR